MELHVHADPHPRHLQTAPAEAGAAETGARRLGEERPALHPDRPPMRCPNRAPVERVLRPYQQPRDRIKRREIDRRRVRHLLGKPVQRAPPRHHRVPRRRLPAPLGRRDACGRPLVHKVCSAGTRGSSPSHPPPAPHAARISCAPRRAPGARDMAVRVGRNHTARACGNREIYRGLTRDMCAMWALPPGVVFPTLSLLIRGRTTEHGD